MKILQCEMLRKKKDRAASKEGRGLVMNTSSLRCEETGTEKQMVRRMRGGGEVPAEPPVEKWRLEQL